jgi:hypothetical protein
VPEFLGFNNFSLNIRTAVCNGSAGDYSEILKNNASLQLREEIQFFFRTLEISEVSFMSQVQ